MIDDGRRVTLSSFDTEMWTAGRDPSNKQTDMRAMYKRLSHHSIPMGLMDGILVLSLEIIVGGSATRVRGRSV